MDWTATLVTCIITFAVYWLTLAPTVTLESSGQLVLAADHLGVGRPPGYPVWTLLAHLFIRCCPWAQYHGYPNPAWAVNLMSAVFGALACAALTLLVSRESSHLRIGLDPINEKVKCVIAVLVGIVFGCTPVMWSQAVITETHTLCVFFLLTYLLLICRWMSTREPLLLFTLAFCFGCGLAVSPILGLLGMILLVGVGLVSFRDSLRVLIALVLFCVFIAGEFQLGARGPQFAVVILIATVLIGLILMRIRKTRASGAYLLLMLSGLLPYLYLPLAAATNPPMNMGYACTWTGFWHLISRGQYEKMVLLNPFVDPSRAVQHVINYSQLLAFEFRWPLLLTGGVAIVSLFWLPGQGRKVVCFFVSGFFITVASTLIGANLKLDLQTQFIARPIFLPSYVFAAILIGFSWELLFQVVMGKRKKSDETTTFYHDV